MRPGFGGNMQNMMKQVQDVQRKMTEMQESFNTKTTDGTSGGGLVKVIITLSGNLKNVTIDPSIMVIDEKETLEDLVVAAFNNAKNNATTQMQQEMDGLGIPPEMLKMMGGMLG